MTSQGEVTGGVGCGAGGDEGNDNQDRRMKALVQQGDEQVQPLQLHRPQRCPRCDSMNTKFCYYNNYSFSQPRYFCKTCRRYWTQGGTLRNVPVGGGCRKQKRARTSGESSRLVPPQQPQAFQVQLDFAAARSVRISAEQGMRANEPGGLGSFGPYYQGGGGTGGYMSSLSALQSLNAPSQPAFNQSMNAAAGDISNLGLSPGFGVSALSLQRQQDVRPSPAVYQGEQGLMPSTMVATGTTGVWTQGYANDAINLSASDSSLWSTMNSTSINVDSGSNGNGGGGISSSMMLNPWSTNLPGCGPSRP